MVAVVLVCLGLNISFLGCGDGTVGGVNIAILTVQTSGQGSVSPNSGAYPVGTKVSLKATANSDWNFDHWEGAFSGSSNPTAITMSSDKTVKAVFVSIQIPPTEKVATPVIHPNGGTFTDNREIIITVSCDTPGATILYTSDGSTPNISSASFSFPPNASFSFIKTSTLKAFAVKNGMLPSDVVSATFTKINNPSPPSITTPSIKGTLAQGQLGAVTVSCTVSDTDGTVQSGKVDLSSIGGSGTQALTKNSGNSWSWSGSVTPSSSGSKTINFTATDDNSSTGTATSTITVSSPSNYLPTITYPSASCILTQGQSGIVTIYCMATDTDGTVQSVKADMSSIGGSNTQSLFNYTGNMWAWNGSVTPSSSGSKTIIFTATDDDRATGTSTLTITVNSSSNSPPTITNPSVSGTLTQSQSGMVTVSCTASDTDGTVQSVKADLSQIGGSSTQALTKGSGNTWSWSGSVTPPSGTKTITFTATDNQGATESATATINVNTGSNSSPSVTSPSVSGTLTQSQSATVTVSCTASDTDGTVNSVVADLSSIGGSSTQALIHSSGNSWSWSGSVTPSSSGTKTITFSASDDKGNTGTGSATINVGSGGSDTITIDCGGEVQMTLIKIPAGTFQMGTNSTDYDWLSVSRPVHQVTISQAFYMGKYEVTQAQYQALIGTNPSNSKDPNKPVERVSWNDAVAFCQALATKSGYNIRLPSEAEWEYACKADKGNVDTKYYFGDDETQLGKYAWYADNSQSTTHAVGTRTPNSFGLYDMSGNVWEWCQDFWHDDYTGAPSDGAAWITGGDQSFRITRGGSSSGDSNDCRSSNRDGYWPTPTYGNVGFRVVSSQNKDYPNAVIKTISVDMGPSRVAATPDGCYIYVTHGLSNKISVIRTSDNTLSSIIPLSNNPFSLVPTPDGKFMYVTHGDDRKISVLQISNNVINTFTPGCDAYDIAMVSGGQSVYVTSHSGKCISVIRASDNTISRWINLTDTPGGIVSSPDGNYLYVTHIWEKKISIIRTSDNTITGSIPCPNCNTLGAMAITPDGGYLYVIAFDKVLAIRTADYTINKTISIGNLGPRGIIMTPDGRYVYVTISGNNTILVIRTSDNLVIDTISVNDGPSGITITPNGNYIYVTSDGWDKKTITVIGK